MATSTELSDGNGRNIGQSLAPKQLQFTKRDLAADVVVACRSELTKRSKYALLNDICWAWSQFTGKIDGCRYWTPAALASKPDKKQLRHEHLVPRKVLIRRMHGLVNPDVETVYAFLDSMCVGVVVTVEEDRRLSQAGLRSKMPDEWDGVDAWARHKAVNLTATDCHSPTHEAV